MHFSQRWTPTACIRTNPTANHANGMGRLHHVGASGLRRLYSQQAVVCMEQPHSPGGCGK